MLSPKPQMPQVLSSECHPVTCTHYPLNRNQPSKPCVYDPDELTHNRQCWLPVSESIFTPEVLTHALGLRSLDFAPHTLAYMLTQTHKDAHTHTFACTYMYTLKYTCMYTHIHKHTRTHRLISMHAHTDTHANMRTCVSINACMQLLRWM